MNDFACLRTDPDMDYYTSVKRKKSAYIPLLLYNYEGELFHLRLGESSLTQLYREFLTEALLTECNSSTCCHLIDNQKGKMIPDSAYRLEMARLEAAGRILLLTTSNISPSNQGILDWLSLILAHVSFFLHYRYSLWSLSSYSIRLHRQQAQLLCLRRT